MHSSKPTHWATHCFSIEASHKMTEMCTVPGRWGRKYFFWSKFPHWGTSQSCQLVTSYSAAFGGSQSLGFDRVIAGRNMWGWCYQAQCLFHKKTSHTQELLQPRQGLCQSVLRDRNSMKSEARQEGRGEICFRKVFVHTKKWESPERHRWTLRVVLNRT